MLTKAIVPAVSLIVLGGVLACSRLFGADESLVGDWAGGFEQGKDYVYLQLHFKAKDGKISGTYDAPLLFQQGRSLKQVTIKSSAVSFEIPNKPDTRLFTGELKDGVLTGQMKEGATERPFRFSRLAPIQAEHYVGTYEIERGHFVFIRSAVEMGLGALQFIDFKTGRVGMLFPTSTTSFFTGPAVLVPYPVEATVTFTLDAQGQATGFAWAGAREVECAESQTAAGRNLVHEWRSDDFRARSSRQTLRRRIRSSSARRAARQRGPARCFDTWPSSLPCMAWQASSMTSAGWEVQRVTGCVRVLTTWRRTPWPVSACSKRGPESTRSRIGLFGASQSGWIVALAASQSKDVAFIISQSGPGVSPEEQELYRSEAWLRADGFSEEEIRDAMKFIRQRYQAALTGEGWDALAETEREARNKSWFAYTGGSCGKGPSVLAFLEPDSRLRPRARPRESHLSGAGRVWSEGHFSTRREKRAHLADGTRKGGKQGRDHPGVSRRRPLSD